jgi:SAM-dependent methyltransferase
MSETASVATHPREHAIRRLYEWKPYPALGDHPKDTARWIEPIRHLLNDGPLRYLDAGCGTGHSVVGMACARRDWSYHAVDISGPSLDIARQLANKFGVRVDFRQASYLDPLPFNGRFDLIACFGSIVVCADPVGAIRNLLRHLADDGILMLWLYCKRAHEPRMVTKEILDTLEPDPFNHTRRFELYRALRRKQRPGPVDALLDLSLRKVGSAVRRRLRPAHLRQQDFDYPYTRADQLWADNFCLPFEHHYDVHDVRRLAEAAGLDVFLLSGQGREDLDLLPEEWVGDYKALERWSRWRLMELLSFNRPRSMQIYGRIGAAGAGDR